MAAAPSQAIHVEGVRELVRVLGRIDRDMRKQAVAEIRQAGGIVAAEARMLAEQKGLRRSGDLIRGIRPSFRGGSVYVRSAAKHAGFNYPKRLEYEGRGPGGYGPRATLHPAADRRRDDVIRAFEDILDHSERLFRQR